MNLLIFLHSLKTKSYEMLMLRYVDYGLYDWMLNDVKID